MANNSKIIAHIPTRLYIFLIRALIGVIIHTNRIENPFNYAPQSVRAQRSNRVM